MARSEWKSNGAFGVVERLHDDVDRQPANAMARLAHTLSERENPMTVSGVDARIRCRLPGRFTITLHRVVRLTARGAPHRIPAESFTSLGGVVTGWRVSVFASAVG